MQTIIHTNKREWRNVICMCLGGLIVSLSLFTTLGIHRANGVDLFPENDKPFGIPYDVWIGKWWTWWFGIPSSELPSNEPRSECLMNISDSMVMLMETTAKGPRIQNQVCNISSEHGIMIPLWTGFWWQNFAEQKRDGVWTTERLNQEAQAVANKGQIHSRVDVDNKTIANVDVVSNPGNVKYNSKVNVYEIYARGFNFTIYKGFGDRYPGQETPDVVGKNFDFGAHGWFVFLEPLKAGDHTVLYTIYNSGEANPGAREFKYLFHVS